jgi:hypothetical protein
MAAGLRASPAFIVVPRSDLNDEIRNLVDQVKELRAEIFAGAALEARVVAGLARQRVILGRTSRLALRHARAAAVLRDRA